MNTTYPDLNALRQTGNLVVYEAKTTPHAFLSINLFENSNVYEHCGYLYGIDFVPQLCYPHSQIVINDFIYGENDKRLVEVLSRDNLLVKFLKFVSLREEWYDNDYYGEPSDEEYETNLVTNISYSPYKAKEPVEYWYAIQNLISMMVFKSIETRNMLKSIFDFDLCKHSFQESDITAKLDLASKSISLLNIIKDWDL